MINQVKLFMQLMGQDMPNQPTIPLAHIQQLRFGLIDEENKELADAAAAGDLVEVADALCDTLYVVFGACLAYGFSPELMEKLFAEVQASNMSKACKTEKEAKLTLARYQDQFPEIPVYIKPIGEYYVICREADGKVLKSIRWEEPDLKSILIKYGVSL